MCIRDRLSFDTSAILQGQVWRIITFIFVPTGSSNIFFFVLTLYFYYFIGSALELSLIHI